MSTEEIAALITPEYPDSEAGALAYIAYETEGGIDLSDATCGPDPVVKGCWLITTPNAKMDYVIVWLKGYGDPFGTVRPNNDFESIYPECAR